MIVHTGRTNILFTLTTLKYMVEIWEAKRDKEHAKELPILIPLVIYHGQQNWKIPSSLEELLKTMMLYIFSVANDLTPTDVDRMIQQLETSNIDGGELAMTLAEMWRQEGLEQGMEIGEAKALSNMAIIQLTNKLGALPKDVKESILKSDSPTLQVILTNIFSIQHVDEVRRYPPLLG